MKNKIQGKWVYLPEYPPDSKRVVVACNFLDDPEIDTARYFSDSGKWQTTTLGIYAWFDVELPPIPGVIEKGDER